MAPDERTRAATFASPFCIDYRELMGRWYGRSKALPDHITAHDLLKTLALSLMVIDHLGLYFIDLDWMRVVGRCSAPIWFFLVGYSNSRNLPPILFIGALALFATELWLGYDLWPLNILVTIFAVRLVLDKIIHLAFISVVSLVLVLIGLLILLPASRLLLEYGTHGILFAMLGYSLRHKLALENWPYLPVILAVTAFGSYFAVQTTLFEFDAVENVLFIFLLAWLCRVLFGFRSDVFEKTDKACWTLPVKILGRRSLEIYVVHLILFKCSYWAWYWGYLDWKVI